jgi:BMFP domain-containing protein YqiC
MLDPKVLEQLAARITAALPPEVGRLRDDANRNLRGAVTAALARLDLVTREEFEVQAAVLGRTRERLGALEERVAALEQQLREQQTKQRPVSRETE